MVAAAIGYTFARPVIPRLLRMNSTTLLSSIGGLVLGMHATDVTPPATAAAVPVAMVSLYSCPGSRRWTWMSTKPGARCSPSPS